MAIRDDILEGDSYFIAEVKSLKRLLDSLNGNIPILAFVDEILKGTNTIERISASASVLKYVGRTNARMLVATHDIELTEVFDQVDKYCFNDIKKDNKIIFDYLIKKGVCTVGNAIAIVKTLDFDQEILKEINDKIEVF